MAKYKVGDIFINHNGGKILQVCKGRCNDDEECYYSHCWKTSPFSNISCISLIGATCHVKELPSLPPGTKVKVRVDLKVGEDYGGYIFNYEMGQYTEVTISCYDTPYKSYQVFENFCHYPLEMFDQVINEPKENNNMETKEIKIKVPEGYEIDEENSTLECIKFKPIKKKELTYEDVADNLFCKLYYYISGRSKIVIGPPESNKDKNNATDKKQLEKLLALNQLLNIAEYYNKKSPKLGKKIYCIEFEKINSVYFVQDYTCPTIVSGFIPKFNREEDAKAVINNPNFKDILDLVYKV